MGNIWLAFVGGARSVRPLRVGGGVTCSFWGLSPDRCDRCIAGCSSGPGAAATIVGAAVVVVALVVVIVVPVLGCMGRWFD